MPRKLVFYSFSSFVLLPIAAILGITSLIALPSAFGSPTALLYIFVLLSFVLYTFTAFSFFVRGIQTGKPFKASFSDFIKVNGYIAAGVSAFMVVFALLFYAVPAVNTAVINRMLAMQPPASSGGMNRQRLLTSLQRFLFGGSVYFILVIVHFIITIQLLKQYGHLFVKKAEE